MNDHRIAKIGIQLFTVQEPLKQDFEGTLAKIATIGYQEVELGSVGRDKSPKDVRVILDRLGLVASATHISYDDMVKDWPNVMEWCDVVGHRYIVVPSYKVPNSDGKGIAEGWKSFAASLNRTAELADKAGVQLAFHNHHREFFPLDDGTLPYDILMEECDPALVKMEMDLAWSYVIRVDPLKYFAQYPGRFPLVHVKGLKRISTGPNAEDFSVSDFSPVGDGLIDWRRIFSHSEQAGIKHYFVEHDNPPAPLESARISYEYLAQLRF